ncbi:MAG TPA: CBS domain-containing protein [Thermodesulfovibrionales bacterium]|nr:CBS domain-containing protein [Thermodesulfovibrionales bacterium]
MALKVKDILKDKGLEVIAIDSTATVDIAINKMIERNIGAILVMEDGNCVGLFTERDVLKCWTKKGAADRVAVRDVMTRDLLIIEPEDDLNYAMTIMTNKRIRHLPVIDHGRVVGLVSIRDVVKYHIGNLEAEVHYLKDYIRGT